MGQWHKPWQVAITIKHIEQDWDTDQLFKYELARGWTDALERKHFWNNTKDRIFNLTGKKYIRFVQPNSYVYKQNLKYYLCMDNKKIKRDKNLWDALKDESKDDLITVIQILKEELEKERAEKAKKEKRKNDCKIIHKISHNSNLSERTLTKAFSINRKTYHNYKNIPNHGDIFRKDFKHNNWFIKNTVLNLFYLYKWTQGANKICAYMNKRGIKISVPTVRRTLLDSNLYVCTQTKKFRPKELKNTNHKRQYLLSKENIKNYSPGEVFSMDFMYINTSRGNRYAHGVIDVISNKIVSLIYCDHMTSDVVVKSLNELPPTAKIVNTDYGTQYFDINVINKLKELNIKHSCGKPGKSTDNGWIERFWKRLRCECLNPHNYFKACDLYINQLIEQYKEFWNNERLLSNLNWRTPNEFIQHLKLLPVCYNQSGVN